MYSPTLTRYLPPPTCNPRDVTAYQARKSTAQRARTPSTTAPWALVFIMTGASPMRFKHSHKTLKHPSALMFTPRNGTARRGRKAPYPGGVMLVDVGKVWVEAS